jgi:hypothetical protein
MVDGEKSKDGSEERPRGILSPADRKYIRGETEYEHRQSKHKRESDIQERFLNALEDIQLLGEELDRPERQRILGLEDSGVAYKVDLGLGWMIALAHRLSVDIHDDLEPTHDPYGQRSVSFQIRLEEGLEMAYLDENLVLEDLTLEVESQEVPGLSEVRERVAEGGPVSNQALRYLLESGEIETEAYFEFLADQLGVEPEFETSQGDS